MGVLDPANIAALDSKDKELLGGLVKLNAEDFECPSGIALPTPPAPEEDEDGKRELEMALMQLLKEDIEDGKGPRPSGDGKGPRPGPPGPPKGDDDFFVPTVQPEKREDKKGPKGPKKGPKGPKKGPKGQKSSESDEDDMTSTQQGCQKTDLLTLTCQLASHQGCPNQERMT